MEPNEQSAESGESDFTVDDEILRTVAQNWSKACAGDALQTMTLRADGSESDDFSDDDFETDDFDSYVIKPRTLCDGNNPQTDPPEYELIEILGEGGMGVVYNARQMSMDRSVAVKVLKSDKDDKERSKFLSEAAVTADLDHPNIVPIYDLGSNGDGALFYSMKRVQGTPWEARIDLISCDENLGILSRVGDAVTFAHARGFIHRDLKPTNVMLGDFGEVLVMDWGLAISIDDNAPWRTRGRAPLAGTPAYMAPEMVQGDTKLLGCRSDVYLLGGILFRILTGQPPHQADTVKDCIVAAARNEIVETDQRGELMDIALRALATDPADRFPDVRSFQDAIRAYQAHFESIQLTERAERELTDVGSLAHYRSFAKAVFRLEEACSLWPGNENAQRSLAQSKLAYARTALSNGDLDLVGSLLIEETPWPDESLAQRDIIKNELFARRNRQKNQKRMLGVLCVAVGLLLILGVSITLWLRGNAFGLAEQLGPAAQQSARALTHVQRSLASLRGWVVLEKEFFKTERRQAWDNEILPALAQLETLSRDAEDSKSLARLAELRILLDELREAQWWIEDVAQSVGNEPARDIYLNEIEPLSNQLFLAATAMIDLERDEPGDTRRKQLLADMADLRASLSHATTQLQELLTSGNDHHKLAYDAQLDNANERLQRIEAKRDLLTVDQRQSFDWVSAELPIYRRLADNAIAIRRTGSWNIAQARLAEEAVPLSEQVNTLLTKIANENSELMRVRLGTTLSRITGIAIAVTGLLAVAAFLVAWNLMSHRYLRSTYRRQYVAS